jgi:putative aldouronate transport system permease protein
VTLPTAYAVSRKKMKGRKVINFLFIMSMYFSGGIVPTYLLHQSIGWLNTIWVMIIPSALNVYYMILARSSFEALPETMYEAASIDGANDFRFFFQFALPLCKATIAVLFLFSALSWWNEYMRFVIYIDDPNKTSLQVIIQELTQTLSSGLDHLNPDEILEMEREKELLKYSIVVVAALPFCLLYPFIQKYFNRGVMVGAIKG